MSWEIFGKHVTRILKRFKKDDKFRGHIDVETFVMVVDQNLSPTPRLQTELHECGHGLMERLSIIDTHSVSPDLEEIIANGFATWIIENRKYLVKRLVKLDRKPTKRTKKKSAPIA